MFFEDGSVGKRVGFDSAFASRADEARLAVTIEHGDKEERGVRSVVVCVEASDVEVGTFAGGEGFKESVFFCADVSVWDSFLGSQGSEKFLIIYKAFDEELAEGFIAGFTIGECSLMVSGIGDAGLVDGVKCVLGE